MFFTLCYSLLLGATYVGSLYCVPLRVRNLPRDEPEHVAWRLALVLPACVAAGIMALSALAAPNAARVLALARMSPFDALGVSARCVSGLHRLVDILAAPAATALLFLGPLVQAILTGEAAHCIAGIATQSAWVRWWKEPGAMLRSLRTLVTAPVTEEWVFRACILAVAAARGASATTALAASAAAFGVAHLHHAVELRRAGASLRTAATAVLGQAAFTSAFGALAGFALLRTGSLPGVALMHAGCNWAGLPDISTAAASWERGNILHGARWLITAAYVGGLVAGVLAFARLGVGSVPPCALARIFADNAMHA